MIKNTPIFKLGDALTFCQKIEKDVADKDLTYLEAISEFCQDSGIKEKNVAKLLTSQLKAKLKNEAINLNMFRGRKKSKKLPFK